MKGSKLASFRVKIFICCLLPVVIFGCATLSPVSGEDSIGDPYIPELGNTGYDVEQYHLALDINQDQETLTATDTIIASATLNRLGAMSLDFTSYEIDSVDVDGKNVLYHRSADKLYLDDLPRNYRKGDTFEIQVKYHGLIRPQTSSFLPDLPLGLSRPVGVNMFTFAEPDGARAWFPCNDHPSDKASFLIEATVPSGLTAISNGSLVDMREDDRKTTYVWSEDELMAPYLLTLVVGQYKRIDAPSVSNIKIRHYIFPADARLEEVLQETNDIVQFLSNKIAPYPFKELGIVEIDASNLAMETQTMIMVDRSLLLSQDAGAVLAHEIAHHWFGDSLSLATWGDIWLNEGFATYYEMLWRVEQGESFQAVKDQLEQGIFQDFGAEKDPLTKPEPRNMFGTNSYFKGAWVLFMLQEELGEETFDQVIHQYYQRYANGNAATADFQAVAEQVSKKDLDGFFQQWAYPAGIPHLKLNWTDRTAGSAHEIAVQVCQTQKDVTYAFQLQIQLDGVGGQQDQGPIQLDERSEQTDLSVPFAPSQLVADPDQLVLADVKIARVDALSPCPE